MWIEEWLLYFSFAYGRIHRRLKDFASTFNIRLKTIPKIIKKKLKIILDCRNRWPLYVSLNEDERLRSAQWNEIILVDKNTRLIMHDMSDVPLCTPEDAELNRALYNSYYGGCCAKGGIFTQPCGWEGCLELFTGSVGDSEYIRRTKILEIQEKVQKSDVLAKNTIVPFVNIFDKGYRVLLDAQKCNQFCWQPAFLKSDERYGSYAVLRTASVAYTRSGNERSVKHLKHSWTISKGFKEFPNINLDIVADLWLARGFQINFMYEPVH